MGPCMDFLNWLEPDMSMKVLTCLDDPSDLVRVSVVSRSWRHFVIENGLCKKLCLRMFHQLSRVACVVELKRPEAKELSEVGSSNSKELETLEREHWVYASLARGFIAFDVRETLKDAISASSTDNYPEESISNTLDSREEVAGRPSYWSSKGQSDPEVSEILIYKLVSNFVVITEINIHPFQADFQAGLPIYSASAVRFRMGHARSPVDVESDPMGESCHNKKFKGESYHNDKFIWTYTSQAFPMTQENRLQNFKLPEPVICIGGILQIELMGRVQRQEMDDLFYICVSHVEVKGKPLSPAFGVEILQRTGEFMLKHNNKAKFNNQPSSPENARNLTLSVQWDDYRREMRQMVPIVNMLSANMEDPEDPEEYYEWDEAEEESDEGFVV